MQFRSLFFSFLLIISFNVLAEDSSETGLMPKLGSPIDLSIDGNLNKLENQSFDPGIGVMHFAQDQLSDEFCKFVLDAAPQEIQDKIILLKDEYCPSQLKPRRLLLFGPSGSGKTTLAKVIAHEIARSVIFINAGLLGNEYQNSAAQNLRRAIEPYMFLSCVVIIDEIDCIIKQSKNEKNPDFDTPKQIWELFDICQNYPNLILIGITNDLRGMPAPLQTRFAGDTIEIPLIESNDIRRKTILFHVKNSFFECDENSINSLCKKTKKFSHRELEKMVIAAMAISYLRDSKERCVDYEDFNQAYKQIEKSRSLLNKINWNDYEKHLQYGLQIANLVVSVASLITNWRMAWLSYVLQREFGEKNLDQSKQLAKDQQSHSEKQTDRTIEAGKSEGIKSRDHADVLSDKNIAHSTNQQIQGQKFQADLADKQTERSIAANEKLSKEGQVFNKELHNESTALSKDQFESGQKQAQINADRADRRTIAGNLLNKMMSVCALHFDHEKGFVPWWTFDRSMKKNVESAESLGARKIYNEGHKVLEAYAAGEFEKLVDAEMKKTV